MTKKKTGDGVRGSEPGGDGGVDPTIAALGYEDAVRQLEALVASIEQGEVGLEESLASYRRGEQLVRHCKALLDRAETTVRQLSVGEIDQTAP
jgi:exodeoxyribonuclease VII small subunit